MRWATLIYILIATIGSFATSCPELASSNRIVRISLGILVGLLHLWPLLPFHGRGITRILIGEPSATVPPQSDIREALVL